MEMEMEMEIEANYMSASAGFELQLKDLTLACFNLVAHVLSIHMSL